MSISERDRHDLYTALEDLFGLQRAATMMALLPPVGWADVATKHDLAALEERLDLRFKALDTKFEGRFKALETRFDALEARVDARFEALEGRFDAQRGEADSRFELMEQRWRAELHQTLSRQFRAVIYAVVTLTTLNVSAVALLG